MDLLRKVAVEQNAAIIAVTHDEKIFDRFDRIFPGGYVTVNGESQARITWIHG